MSRVLGMRRHVFWVLLQVYLLYSDCAVYGRSTTIRKLELNDKGPGVQQDKQETDVRKVQKLHRFNVSGHPDKSTIAKMEGPRCGTPDCTDMQQGPQTRQRRISRSSQFQVPPKKPVLPKTRWYTIDLKYCFRNFPKTLTPAGVEMAAKDAFKQWSRVSALRFTRAIEDDCRNSVVEIMFCFVGNNQLYAKKSDGPGNMIFIAHGPDRRPSYKDGGSIFIDDNEEWTLMEEFGLDLMVAMTEAIGHVIGVGDDPTTDKVGHRDTAWRKYTSYYRIGIDQVSEVKRIYGEVFENQYATYIPAEATNSSLNAPNICKTGVDATTTISGTTYAFKNNWVYRLTPAGALASGKNPSEIKEHFRFLSVKPYDGIDAVFQRRDNMTIFFKGNRFYEHSEITKSNKHLSWMGLNDAITHITAALAWKVNNKDIHLYSDRAEFEMNSSGKFVINNNPFGIRLWRGIPVPFDSLYMIPNGTVYFIKGVSIYPVNPSLPMWHVIEPRRLEDVWTFCRNKTSASIEDRGSFATTTIIWKEMIIAFISVATAFNLLLKNFSNAFSQS